MDRISGDYFELFSLPERYRIDLTDLEARYKALQLQVHPDRYAGRYEQEKRLALQYSGLVNEAYDTLRNPLKRGAYILKKHGHDPFDELDTELAPEFLMLQMELRENLEEAEGDAEKVGRIRREVEAELQKCEEQLVQLLDRQQAWKDANRVVREMSYFVKMRNQTLQGATG